MNTFKFHLISGATVGGCGDVANKGPGGIRNIFTAESEIFSQQSRELKSQRFESCIFSSYCQPSVGDAGAPVFRLIPTKDLGVEGGPTERVSDRKLYLLVLMQNVSGSACGLVLMQNILGSAGLLVLMQNISGSACGHSEHKPV